MIPSRQSISERAYLRWLANGQPSSTQARDWAEAEAELNSLAGQADGLARKASPESGHLLGAILEHAPAIVYAKDAQGRYLLVNQCFERRFQVTQAQIAGKTDHDILPAAVANVLRENDRRALASGRPLEFEEVVPHPAGTRTYLSLKFPINGPGGRPYAICGLCTDITERKLAQRRLLAEHAVTRALADSATPDDATPRALQAICESLGWAVGLYWSVDRAANVLRCQGIWHAPKPELSSLGELCRRTTFAPGIGLPGRVWADGKPAWVPDVATGSDSSPATRVLNLDRHGACGFPVVCRGEPVGVIEFLSPTILRAPSDELLAMMASVSSQMGQYIERKEAALALHARERELSLARAIQQRRLPTSPPAQPGYDIGGKARPAQETGGDYLDFIPLPDGSLGIAVGDASGHGIAAALLMAETRAYLRALAQADPDVGKVLGLVNRHVAEAGGDDFITLLFARLDSHSCSLVHSSAGHCPGYLLSGRGEVKGVLHSTGLPLGIDPTAAFPSGGVTTLVPGDLLLFYTDGVTEAFSPAGLPFGSERVLDCVRAHLLEPASAIVDALLDEAQEFAQGLQGDDMSAVVVKLWPTLAG